MIWFIRRPLRAKPVVESPAGINADGDSQIRRLVDAEEHDEQAHAITVARSKLKDQSVRYLSDLAKELRVYDRAANFLGGHPTHTPEQIKGALIDAIVSVPHCVASLADDDRGR